jgi:hypothetical protein
MCVFLSLCYVFVASAVQCYSSLHVNMMLLLFVFSSVRIFGYIYSPRVHTCIIFIISFGGLNKFYCEFYSVLNIIFINNKYGKYF